jgi:hypothetical protein
MNGSIFPLAAPAFDDLVREALSLIPAYAPQWTNHNPSDPGITLVELLAYYTEILAYRALRITPDAKLNYLRLLDGGAAEATDALHGQPVAAVDDAIRSRVRALSQTPCAVTCRDFEQAATIAAQQKLGSGHAVRALCVAGVDLRRSAAADSDAPADISVVLAPEQALSEQALRALCDHVQQALAPRCLLTTRVHVVAPVYVQVFVGCRIALHAGCSLPAAIAAIDEALRRRFGPADTGESLADARPLGQALHLSEVAEVIDRTDGIDYVEQLAVLRMRASGGEGGGDDDDADADWRTGVRIGSVSHPGQDARLGGRVSVAMRRIQLDDIGEAESVTLYPWEAVRVKLEPQAVIEITDGDDGTNAANAWGAQDGR